MRSLWNKQKQYVASVLLRLISTFHFYTEVHCFVLCYVYLYYVQLRWASSFSVVFPKRIDAVVTVRLTRPGVLANTWKNLRLASQQQVIHIALIMIWHVREISKNCLYLGQRRLRHLRLTLFEWICVHLMTRCSRVAQRKRAGPITQRSMDRNHPLLVGKFSFWHELHYLFSVTR